MAIDDDVDSWEHDVQAALEIHRRTVAEMRNHAALRKGSRRKKAKCSVVPRSKFMRDLSSHSKEPPAFTTRTTRTAVSSRTETNKDEPTCVPTIDNVSLASASRAELEAWATLTHINTTASDSFRKNQERPCRSKSAGILNVKTTSKTLAADHVSSQYNGKRVAYGGRARRSSAKAKRGVENLLDDLERFGTCIDASSTPFIATTKRPASASVIRRSLISQDTDGYPTVLAESLSIRRREDEQLQSDVSVRFLREHAKRTQEEDKAFHLTLKAEVRALEDSQVENIHRATHRSRSLGESAVYVPHRVSGKMHVLKIADRGKLTLDRERRGPITDRSLAEYGKVMTMNCFMRTDYARLEKEFCAQRKDAFKDTMWKDGIVSTTGRVTCTKERQRGHHPQRQPSANMTRQELCRLVKDTAGLVEVITAQSIELESQGWNRNSNDRVNERRGAET